MSFIRRIARIRPLPRRVVRRRRLSPSPWSKHGSLFRIWVAARRSSERWRSTVWAGSLPLLTMRSRFISTIARSSECRKARKLSRCWAREGRNSSLICDQSLAISLPRGSSRITFKCRWSFSIGSSWRLRSRNCDRCKKLSRKKPSNLKWKKFNAR